MVRRALALPVLFALLLPLEGSARDRLQEAGAALASFESGSMTATQAANRIINAGGEARVTEYVVKRLPEVFESRRRAGYFELLSMLATPNAALADLAARTLQETDDLSVRLSCIRILGRMKQPALATVLGPLLGDKVLGVRREAARALLALKAVKTAPLFARAAAVEDDPETRALLIVGVGRLGDVKQAKAIEPLLDSSSETTRVAAAQALCLLGQKKGFDAARAMLASADKYVRQQGVMLFEGADARVSRNLLEPMTTDPEVSVRARAARILAQGGDARWVDWLVLEGYRGTVDDKLVFESELELLRLSDEQRGAILRRAGLK